jgi:hypothetical protein
MSIGSISASTVASAYDAMRPAEQAAPRAEAPSIADHVAAADEETPIRSLSTTLGTLVDTYL